MNPELLEKTGDEMHAFIAEAFPLCRSITGDGVRRTLAMIAERIPLAVHEVPSGTQVFDWTVPKEWNIRDAWIANARGERVVDFRDSNLHVVNYSVPVRATMSLPALFAPWPRCSSPRGWSGPSSGRSCPRPTDARSGHPAPSKERSDD